MEERIGVAQKLLDTAIEFLVKYSFDILGAIIVLLVGFWITKYICKSLSRFLEKKKVDVTLSKFTVGFVHILSMTFVILIALGNFGITVAPFIAAISAMAFGASFAIQGPLSNYGAGLSIILSRPFVVGDTITIQGFSGVVEEVSLAMTRIVTEDKVKITIPNRHIVGEVLLNSKLNKVVDEVIGISYNDDPEKAIRVIREVIGTFSEVTKEPQPQVGIAKFGESSIDIGTRYWIPTTLYFQILYQVNLAIFKALKRERISIPYPQRDVHIVSNVKP